ncbi:ABC transporter ATP-binding protein [Salinicoccus sp. Marseille-QA3877]
MRRLNRAKKNQSWKAKIDQFFALNNTEGNIIREAPPVPLKEIFKWFWPYTKNYRKWIVVGLIFIALKPLTLSGTVWLLQIFIDNVLDARNLGPLLWIVLLYLGLSLAGGIFSFAGTCVSNWVGQNFVLSLRKTLFEHLQSLSLHFFEGRKLGDIIARLTGDISSIERLIVSGATSALSYIFQLIVFIGMLFFMEWKLALVSLIVVPLFYMVTRYFSVRMKLASRERSRRMGAINSLAEEGFSNISLMQAFNQEKHEASKFQNQNVAAYDAQMTKVRLKATFSPTVSMIETGGTLTVMVFGAFLLMQNEVTIGVLVAFLTLLRRLYSPVRGLSKLLNTIYSASASAERVIEFMEQKPQVISENGEEINNNEGSISFRDVSFAYPGKKHHVLSDLSFNVNPGETVALVGASGVGKSTIVKMLMRFYEPSEGEVYLNGHALKDTDLQSLRNQIAVVFQESLIFDGTVRENIAYGKPDATTEEIIEAAKKADAHGFISNLSDGYDTNVGQKGRNLSGGQQQRVAIARAMIRKASVVILDEPAEGLDGATEKRVMQPMQRLMENTATLMITHNLRSASIADKIVYLDKENITEIGTHDELISQNGNYKKLYTAQQGEEEKEDKALEPVAAR